MSYIRPTAIPAGTVPEVPPGIYIVGAKSAIKATSKGETKNPLVKAEVEILSPDTNTFNGHEVRTAGKTGTMNIAFSEKNLQNVVNLFDALGVPLPPPAANMADDIEGMRDALVAALPGLCWQMPLKSERNEYKKADGTPVLDNAGSPIYGRDRLDFPMFGVLPRTYQRYNTTNPY